MYATRALLRSDGMRNAGTLSVSFEYDAENARGDFAKDSERWYIAFDLPRSFFQMYALYRCLKISFLWSAN